MIETVEVNAHCKQAIVQRSRSNHDGAFIAISHHPGGAVITLNDGKTCISAGLTAEHINWLCHRLADQLEAMPPAESGGAPCSTTH